ncbi:MAG TPA: hypothetical protein DEA26_02660 [Oceanospirillales bacterium]|nr:hypothetical protein [Oceanospirillaceae bacterium]HBS41556.1 hypothetical protein [Oceanospirillales bacterium]|tara:strand:- start:47837 stop:48784 length:948 start_codon:yes stop_codon:yes gene_type:complete
MDSETRLWPESLHDTDDWHTLAAARPALDSLPEGWLEQWQSVWLPLSTWLAAYNRSQNEPPVIGIHGGQGSGKSTLSNALAALYARAFGWQVVVVSIDDLYLSRADRQQLAVDVHPLLVTRGVPGTHDAALGMNMFNALKSLGKGDVLRFPAFDKVSDDRLPEAAWHEVTGPIDMILFEGWCVGCQPADEASLTEPVNTLEANEDADGRWRHWVNDKLSGEYADWFAMLDKLIMLKVPDMSAVQRWRTQQEADNRRNTQGTADRSLDDAAIVRFIQHYERLTRNALKTLPTVADLVLDINQAHQVSAVRLSGSDE